MRKGLIKLYWKTGWEIVFFLIFIFSMLCLFVKYLVCIKTGHLATKRSFSD